VKERPILFSGPLVREIRAGLKNVTRRPMKPQPEAGRWPCNQVRSMLDIDGTEICFWSPYGWPRSENHRHGERLWVRETHLVRGAGAHVIYRADLDPVEATGVGAMYGGWRPSIFMRREHSRLLLEVLAVRVERLRSITCDEIRREGLSCPVHDFPGGFCHGECGALREHFYGGWDALYSRKPELHAERDPWLWVVDFKLLEDTTA